MQAIRKRHFVWLFLLCVLFTSLTILWPSTHFFIDTGAIEEEIDWFRHHFSVPAYSQYSPSPLIPSSGEVNNLLFFKTHKTAGSTLSHIFFRKLCRSEKLSCFLPKESNPGRTWDLTNYYDRIYIRQQSQQRRSLCPQRQLHNKEQKEKQGTLNSKGSVEFNIETDNCTNNCNGNQSHEKLRSDSSSHFNVWTNHLIFSSRQLLHELVPTSNHIISIVRRPTNRFRSAWSWYPLTNFSSLTFDQFMLQLSKLHYLVVRVLGISELSFSAIVNILYSFPYRTGLDATAMELMGITNNYYLLVFGRYQFRCLIDQLKYLSFSSNHHQLDSDLDPVLLLIADRFDESVVLLSSLYNWPIHQMAYFPKKVTNRINSGNDNVESLQGVASQTVDLDTYQPLDSALFTIANIILDKYISSYPLNGAVGFKSAVNSFQIGQRHLASYCAEFSSSINSSVLLAYENLLRISTALPNRIYLLDSKFHNRSRIKYQEMATIYGKQILAFQQYLQLYASYLSSEDLYLLNVHTNKSSNSNSNSNSNSDKNTNEIGFVMLDITVVVSWNLCQSLSMDNRESVVNQWRIRRELLSESEDTVKKTKIFKIDSAFKVENENDRGTKEVKNWRVSYWEALQVGLELEDRLLSVFFS